MSYAVKMKRNIFCYSVLNFTFTSGIMYIDLSHKTVLMLSNGNFFHFRAFVKTTYDFEAIHVAESQKRCRK